MAILSGVRCDICGRTLLGERCSRKDDVRVAREEGWRLGNTDRCPYCVEKERNRHVKPCVEDEIGDFP